MDPQQPPPLPARPRQPAYVNYKLPGPDPGPGGYEINNMIVGRMSTRRQIEWLRRSRSWRGLDPGIWRARKVIGVGGNGIVGLWDYQGDNAKMPKHMAVKQGIDRTGMAWESRMLKILAGSGSNHIVKIYKSMYAAGGTGAVLGTDRLPFDYKRNYSKDYEVYRYYLEYCENGDLAGYSQSLYFNQTVLGLYVPEEHMWRICTCLAKAILVLEQGTEDPNIGDPSHAYPIAHFDIKPPNVLIGGRDATGHSRLNIFKLADFGLALPVTTDTGHPEWIRLTRWRATRGYMSPEQRYETHENRLIGVKTNVWAVGAVMHTLLCGKTVPHTTFQYRREDNATFKTQGSSLLEPVQKKNPDGSDAYLPYSRHLIDTVLHCLAWLPRERCSAADLVRTCEAVLQVYEQMPAPPQPANPLTATNPLTMPNIRPQGRPLLVDQLPPLNNLQATGAFQIQMPKAQAPVGPSPADPRLIFWLDRPATPVQLLDYPFRGLLLTP